MVDLKRRACTGLTGAHHMTFLALDNALDHGKTKTGPLPNLFGGVERLKDVLYSLFVHAMSGI